jgi:acyl-CoA thioester hydrolase
MDSPVQRSALTPSVASGEADSPFQIDVRIYYEDTDVGGVVYYANYLRYLERARTDWLRAAGFELDAIQRDMKAVFVVRRVEADYHRPALLGNIITVSCEPQNVGHSKLVVAQRVSRRAANPSEMGSELLLSATVTLAFIASDLSKPIAMPPEMRRAMQTR